MQRRAPQARGPGGHRRRHQHPRVHEDVRHPRARVPGRARPDGDGAADRRADRQGDPRAADLPRQRRGRVPPARPCLGDPLRRRGPAPPPGDTDREPARGRPVHPRRALDRAPPARQRKADRDARSPPRPRQYRPRRGARRADDARGRLARRHGPRRRRARRLRRRGRTGAKGRAQRQVDHGPVPFRHARDRRPRAAHRGLRLVLGARRLPAQPQGDRRRVPGREARLRDGRVWFGQVHAGERDRLQGAREPPQPAASQAGRARRLRGDRVLRQGDRHRSVADRPDASLQPGDLHEAVRPHPRAVLADARGEGARVQARPLLVQRPGRALRDLQGRRDDQDRDALPARRLRPVRDLSRAAL